MCVEVSMVRAVARKIAAELGMKGFTADRDWVKRFMERHPDVVPRVGELTSRKRLRSIHPDRMAHYYNSLKPLVMGLAPHQVWNMDEWGYDLMNVSSTKVSIRVLLRSPLRSPLNNL
jgi:hypothetical protein